MRAKGRPLLLVDGGDFVHRNGMDNYLETILVWKEMVRAGYDAITLGELEFSQWDLVDSLMQTAPLPVVCSNVECLRDGTWEPVGQRHRILTINGIRVGVLGVIAQHQLNPTTIRSAGERIRLLPPMEALQAELKQIRDQVDVVVLLAHLDPGAMEQYAASLPEVDVVLGGHMTKLDAGPVLSANAILNRSSTRGQHMAITRLIFSPDNEIVDFGGLNVTLEPEYPEDPAVAEAAVLARDEDLRLVKERAMRRRDELIQQNEAGKDRSEAEPSLPVDPLHSPPPADSTPTGTRP